MENLKSDTVQPNKNNKKTSSEKSTFFDMADFLGSIITVLFAMLVILSVLVRYATVDGTSMAPTFKHEDRTLVSNLLYSPRHGDVVAVFEKNYDKKALIKRVIGLPGDVIDIKGGYVYRNGTQLNEPYLMAGTIEGHGDQTYPFTVPKGSVFVMGDNRNVSKDSRFTSVGAIEYNSIIGRVIMRFYPIDEIKFF